MTVEKVTHICLNCKKEGNLRCNRCKAAFYWYIFNYKFYIIILQMTMLLIINFKIIVIYQLKKIYLQ